MSVRPPWLASLRTMLEPQQIAAEAEDMRHCVVDGRVPAAIIYPQTFAQAAEVLGWAQREKLAVVPWGSGTKISMGGCPKRVDVVLSTRRLQQIHDYEPANFTITVEAGAMFSAVAHLVAAQMQTLPLQYAFSSATLGGLIAINALSPKWLRYGGIRDRLLGIRVALPSGEVVHFGGQVVKNVAGYDMCKLFLGSLGSLGVILEATFKLDALPEREATLLAMFRVLSQGANAAAELMATPLLPSQVLLLGPSTTQEVAAQLGTQVAAADTLLLVDFEGQREAVARQLAEMSRICRRHAAQSLDVLSGEALLRLRQRLEGIMQDAARPAPGGLVGRLGTLPARVPLVMEAATQLLSPLAPQALLIGDCGVGVVRFCVHGDGFPPVPADELLSGAMRELRGLVASEGGYVVVEAAPAAIKDRLDVWAPLPQAFPLLQALKRRFDPVGVLNPGRFIGGL